MTAGNPPIPPTQAAFLPPTPSGQQNAASPPSKRDLTSWWKNFKKNAKKEEEKGEWVVRAPPVTASPFVLSSRKDYS